MVSSERMTAVTTLDDDHSSANSDTENSATREVYASVIMDETRLSKESGVSSVAAPMSASLVIPVYGSFLSYWRFLRISMR